MAKKRRKKKRKARQRKQSPPPGAVAWQEADGFHMLAPGTPPTPDMLEEMTREYQEQIRNSPLWDEWVEKFGKKKAEELLKQCRAELRPTRQGLLSRLIGLFIKPRTGPATIEYP